MGQAQGSLALGSMVKRSVMVKSLGSALESVLASRREASLGEQESV
jgi:hypothetical protein